jgi:hypothetical protein
MAATDIRNIKTNVRDESSLRRTRGSWVVTVPGVAGICFLGSWIVGLAVPAPSPKFAAPGTAIATAFAGHQGAVALQFALTEGLPAAGLAIITVALARAIRRAGNGRAGRIAIISGGLAAVISLVQAVTGIVLAWTTSPAAAHALFQVANRGDGIKMLALAVLAVTAAASTALPCWLRGTAALLGASIALSGVLYLLLVQSLANVAAAPALVLLLVFITSSGLILGRRVAGGRGK